MRANLLPLTKPKSHFFECAPYLFPLVDVADEPREPQQPQQAQDFSKTHNPQCSRRLIHLRVDALLHNQEDIIHRDGRHKVYYKPGLQVLLLDSLGVQDDVWIVLYNDACAKIQHQVHEEEGVGHHIEDDPRRSGLVFEESDAHRDDDQVAHHEEKHGEIPVESAGELGDKLHNLAALCVVSCDFTSVHL